MAAACIISSGASGNSSVIATVTGPNDEADVGVMAPEGEDNKASKHLLQVPGQECEAADEADTEDNFEDE